MKILYPVYIVLVGLQVFKIQWTIIQSRRLVLTLYGVLALSKLVGWQTVVLVLLHSTIMFLVMASNNIHMMK